MHAIASKKLSITLVGIGDQGVENLGLPQVMGAIKVLK